MPSKLWKYAKSNARCVLRFLPGKVAIRITTYYCQNTSVVGGKVKELRDRVYNLSKVIVETFKPNNENGSDEVIVKAAKGIEQDIMELLR